MAPLLKNIGGSIGYEEETLVATTVCSPHSNLVLGRDLLGQSTLGTPLILLSLQGSKLGGAFP